MSPMKRMPYHRVIWKLSDLQGWSGAFRTRVDNLKQTILNYKGRLESTLVQPHKALEQGGHKASQIKADPGCLIPTAEAFCNEIRAARGSFGSLQERMSNLTGVGFIQSWASGPELESTYEKNKVRVYNNRLECAEEAQPHSDIFGSGNINFESPAAGNYDFIVKANDSSTYVSSLTSTVMQEPGQNQSVEKVFRLSTGFSKTFDQNQASTEPFFFYLNYLPLVSSTNSYIKLTEQNNFITVSVSSSGITVDGIFYSYNNIIPSRTSGSQYYKLTVTKYKNYFWEVHLDGVFVHRKSYFQTSVSHYADGTIYPSLAGVPLTGLFGESKPTVEFGPNTGYLHVKEFGLTQFSTSASIYQNIEFNSNGFTVEAGKLNGVYVSEIRNIYKNRGSIAKKLNSEYSGPKPRAYIRFSETEPSLKNKEWIQVSEQGTVTQSTRTKPFYQFKLEISGSGNTESTGSTVLLSNLNDYKVTNIAVGGTAISNGNSSSASTPNIPFSNSIDDVMYAVNGSLSVSYWQSSSSSSSLMDAWIGYNFGSNKSIKTIIFSQAYLLLSSVWGWNWASSIKIQKSSNGTVWEDVQTVGIIQNSSIQLINVVDTPPAQYWRIKANSSPLRSSPNAGTGWAISLLQMFEEPFTLREIDNYVQISDRVSFQGSNSSAIPNGDLSQGLTGWSYQTEITNLDPTKTAPWSESAPWYSNSASASVTSPSFLLKGPIEFAYKVKKSGYIYNTVAYVYDSSSNSLLYSVKLGGETNWTISKLYPPKRILNKNVYIRFYHESNSYNSGVSVAGLVAGIGVSYIKLLDAKYISIPKKIEGNKIKKIKWKQKVGSSGDTLEDSVYPNIILKTGISESETTGSSESLLSRQITPPGVWTDCSVNVDQLGTYVALGAFFGKADAHDYLVEVKDFEVEWEEISVTNATTVTKTTFEYESYLYYQEGEAYYRFDSNEKGTKWGRFFCDGGFEPTASNDNNKWEMKVLKNITDEYPTIDDFSKAKASLVVSPSPGSSFPVSGNGSNSACLFSAYFYNDTANDVSLSVSVSSSGSGNKWQVFRNRNSLGLSKSSYSILFPSKAWTRVDLVFRRFGNSTENFVTNANWTSALTVMNSTQDINPEVGMFSVKILNSLTDEPNVDWTVLGNDQSIGQTGRFLIVKVKTKSSQDRMLSTGTVYFGASYTGDLTSGIATNVASLAENLARTNFELKTLTLADYNNLLHIVQDVFEDSSDISPLSSNVTRDGSVPGVVQVSSNAPGILLSNAVTNSYIPGFAMVVADATGNITYEVSRDNGVTWTLINELNTMIPFTSNAGVKIVFKATLQSGAVLKRWALIL